LTEEGLPYKGILSLTYYSGEGKELNGCKAFVNFRKSLLAGVLIKEEEVVPEEFRSRPRRDAKQLFPGEKCFLRHISEFFLLFRFVCYSLFSTYSSPSFRSLGKLLNSSLGCDKQFRSE
jgi:hypothetical protein